MLEPIVLTIDKLRGDKIFFTDMLCLCSERQKVHSRNLRINPKNRMLHSSRLLCQICITDFIFFLDQDITIAKDPLLATVSHSVYKIKSKSRKIHLNQKLIALANNIRTKSEANSDCNRTKGEMAMKSLLHQAYTIRS